MRGCATHILTLILYDTIPNAVRSARGRSHEASCGWDRMRRPRPGENASPAPGRRRELRPAATTSRPPGAWPPGADRPPCASPKTRRPAGETDGTRKARPGAVRKTPAMARHEAPASLERERGTERTMVAPPGAPSPSPLRGEIVENGDRLAQGLDKQHGRYHLAYSDIRKCCRLPTPVTTLQQL